MAEVVGGRVAVKEHFSWRYVLTETQGLGASLPNVNVKAINVNVAWESADWGESCHLESLSQKALRWPSYQRNREQNQENEISSSILGSGMPDHLFLQGGGCKEGGAVHPEWREPETAHMNSNPWISGSSKKIAEMAYGIVECHSGMVPPTVISIFRRWRQEDWFNVIHDYLWSSRLPWDVKDPVWKKIKQDQQDGSLGKGNCYARLTTWIWSPKAT